MGRVGISAKDFYIMTLGEVCDAIIAHSEMEHQRLQWQLWGVRKQIIWAIRCAGDNNYKEQDVFELDIDDEIRKDRIKNMEPIKVTEYGSGE